VWCLCSTGRYSLLTAALEVHTSSSRAHVGSALQLNSHCKAAVHTNAAVPQRSNDTQSTAVATCCTCRMLLLLLKVRQGSSTGRPQHATVSRPRQHCRLRCCDSPAEGPAAVALVRVAQTAKAALPRHFESWQRSHSRCVAGDAQAVAVAVVAVAHVRVSPRSADASDEQAFPCANKCHDVTQHRLDEQWMH
jgi:hypothetical protein